MTDRTEAVTPATLDLATTVRHAPAPHGTALVLPGFLDTKDGPATVAIARAMAAVGLTSVCIDPRGTGASPGDPLDLCPTSQLADIAGLLDRFTSPGRTVLIGHCYSALLAGLAATADQRVTDVVALMPSRWFLWPREYDERRDTWRLRGEHAFVRGTGGTIRTYRVPYAVVEDARRHDLPAALRQLRQRILFVAGEFDDLIPPASVQRLYDECDSPDKSLVVLPGVQHDYRDHPEQTSAVVTTVLRWLTER